MSTSKTVKTKIAKTSATPSTTKPSTEVVASLVTVQEHYQEFPYPFRDPEDETQRLLMVCGENLYELNHFLYKGKEDFNKGFRVLIAGGGTGDSAIYMAEQLKNKKAEIVYLDFSKPSMEVAQKRAEKRGLTNITWVLDSILNIPNLNLGKFDFINCSGVLHHLQSPPAGLKILQDSLTANGGMMIMVYGQYGRTGVYQMQDIMKMVNQDISNRVAEVMNAKLILDILPATNWLVRGKELVNDVATFGDIGVYDLFLHKQDRAYTIPELYEFIHDAGLHFVEFNDVAEKLALRPESHIKDFSLLQRIKKMDVVTQQAICELIVGNIIKHTFYASNQKDSIANFDNLNNVPLFWGLAKNISQQIYDHITNLQPSHFINFTLNNQFIQNHNIQIPIGNYTKNVVKQMIDGNKSFAEICDAVREELQQEISNEALMIEIKNISTPFLNAGNMLFHDKSVTI